MWFYALELMTMPTLFIRVIICINYIFEILSRYLRKETKTTVEAVSIKVFSDRVCNSPNIIAQTEKIRSSG